MDPNLAYALVEAQNPFDDEIVGRLAAARGAARPKLAGELLTDEPIASGMVSGPELTWRPSSALFRKLYKKPDGATIQALDGIERHPELGLIDLEASLVADLSPLRALKKLKRLRLTVTPRCDLSPLGQLKKLERVDVRGASGRASQALLKGLEGAGVAVDRPVDWAKASAPFADRMLKLAVLHALLSARKLKAPKLFVMNEYELDEGNLARLLAALAPASPLLATITELAWSSGGFDLQHKVYPQWDGEADTFDVKSLAGIEALTSLRKLRLSPLKPLTKDVKALKARGIAVEEY